MKWVKGTLIRYEHFEISQRIKKQYKRRNCLKTIYKGELPWTVFRFKLGFAIKKEGGVFDWGLLHINIFTL